MKALKGNKVYTIGETEKAHYVALGFDIQDDEGNVITHGRGKTVPYDTYAEVVKELKDLKKLKTEEKDDLSGKSVEELKEYAAATGIDIGNASSLDGILKKIKEAQKA